MQQRGLQNLFIYRMTHIDNVPFIVKNGLWSKLGPVQDPNFRAIGNPGVIDRRTNKPVGVVPPGGVLGEYIPFYFAGHSPMLLNIATGYNVEKVPQRDLVFLVCDAIEIINAGIPFCFTDGNAAKSITTFFNSLYGLKELDWNTIRATIWANTYDDIDRVRKKSSEFLAKDHIPSNMIKNIIVRNKDAEIIVRGMVSEVLPCCEVKTDEKNELFYLKYD